MLALGHQGADCRTFGDVGCGDCHIRETSVCKDLDANEMLALEHIAHFKTFAARQTLFSQGDGVAAVFNVKRGVLRLYKLLSDGRRQIVGFAIPGDFLGLSLNETFSMSAEAITDVEMCRFDRRAFVACVDAKPHLLRNIQAFTSRELLIAQEQMVLLGRRTAQERVAAFLLTLRDRYRGVGICDVTVALPMTRQDIADYCGLTLETVSRTFSKLAREKLIVIVPDGIRLLAIDHLKSLIA